MLFLAAAALVRIAYSNRTSIGGSIVGTVGRGVGIYMNWKGRQSTELRRRQAIREYNALVGRTGHDTPTKTACMECAASGKAERRRYRNELIEKAKAKAKLNNKKMPTDADQFSNDMDRVEDAKLALHTYTANENPEKQEGYLKGFREAAPPGFKTVSADDDEQMEAMAGDFGVDKDKLQKLVANPANSSQKIMVYERDVSVLGPGPKYTVAFRGSTSDLRDWDNNFRNDRGFEAPHQKNAARLGELLGGGADLKGKNIDDLVSTTGHSKGGSEAQAFAAASGAQARVFNPAGFDPANYKETMGVDPKDMRIDVTSVINRDDKKNVIKEGSDPMYWQQHGVKRLKASIPVTTGKPRELKPIDPNRSVPSDDQSTSEYHSMVQVIEALERDKADAQKDLEEYVNAKEVESA